MTQSQSIPLGVLVIDDSEATENQLVEVLSAEGYAVRHGRVSTARALLEALEAGPWDVLLSDFHLSELELAEVLLIAGEHPSKVPLIVVASAIGEQAVARALRSGALDFVSRDDLGELGAAVERVLGLAHAKRRQRDTEVSLRHREIELQTSSAALRLAEERFRSAFDEAPVGIALVDLDWRFIKVNRSLCEILGYPEAKLMELTFLQLTHPDDIEQSRRNVQQLFDGEVTSYQHEKRYFHRKGPTIWASLSVSLVRDTDGSPLHFIAQVDDITAAKQSEASLREAKARLEAIFQHAPAELSLRSLDGRYRQVNQHCAASFGLTPEQMAGRHPDEFIGRENALQLYEEDRAVWESRAPLASEMTVAGADGSEHHYYVMRYPILDDDGEVDAFGTFALDISSRKRAEAVRERALRDLEEAQGIAKLGSWTWNPDTDAATWSDQMYRIFGRAPEAGPATAEGLFAYVVPEDRRRVAEGYRQAFGGGASFELDYRIVGGDGVERTLHAHGRQDPDHPESYSGTVQDVTELRATEAELRIAEERFRSAFEHAPVGMALATLDGHFAQVNEALCEITGYSRVELLATSSGSITHPEDSGSEDALMARLLTGELARYECEKRYLRANGDVVWVLTHATVLRDRSGHPQHVLMQVLDITERRRLETELRHMADHDPLTGLLNRRGLEAEIERHVVQVNRYGDRGALLVIDLDHFKAVNDTLGHEAGDQVIVAVAGLLTRRRRASDTVARLGGDEFAILLPEAGEAAAQLVAESIVADVHERAMPISGGAPQHVTASVGVTMFHQGLAGGEEALVNADLAMYDAKEAGRDRLAIHSADQQDQSRMKVRLAWIERIRSALENDQLTLYAQPILNLSTGEVRQHELLLRMMDATGDSIPPAAFLFIAERYDLVQELDRWVVTQAIRLIEAGTALAGGAVEINISGKSLGDEILMAVIERELSRSGVDPNRLIFEVTETAAIANIVLARRFAEHLKELGCRFALDDFGAGFGSFYYLKHIPFDYLKIDGEFVTGCLANRTDQLVIESLVGIARGLSKQTIAEGVEDGRTEQFLRLNGVDFAQGYHVGRPFPVLPASRPVNRRASGPSSRRVARTRAR